LSFTALRCTFRTDIDGALTALEYCVKQYNKVPSYSNILRQLIDAEDADKLQKGVYSFFAFQCNDDLSFYHVKFCSALNKSQQFRLSFDPHI